MIMPASSFLLSAATVALFASIFVEATPIQQKRSAGIIPMARRHSVSSHKFDAEAVRRDVARMHKRYSTRAPVASGSGKSIRRSVEALEPFDINELRKARRGSSGAESLNNDQDMIYWGGISVGTPPQSITINFDTGSSDLVIPTTDCTNNCTGPLFNFAASSTFVATSNPFIDSYGDGSNATGIVASDIVTVAGLTVTGQGFGAASAESSGFSGGPNAGLLGLAFPSIARTQTTPFFHNLVNQGLLASNLFSMYLSRANATTTESELCIGCIDTTRATGEIAYYPLDASSTNGTQEFWSIASAGTSHNGEMVTPAISAIIDSGTALILIPAEDAAALYAQIPGVEKVSKKLGPDGLYAIACDSLATIGTIAVVFGETAYAVNPADLGIGEIDGGMCGLAIIGSSPAPGQMILGDSWMRNWYSVFDLGNSRIGFAPAV